MFYYFWTNRFIRPLLILFGSIVAISTVSAQDTLLNTKVSFSCQELSVIKALKKLAPEGANFYVSDKSFRNLPKVTISVTDMPIKDIIYTITTGIEIEIIPVKGGISIRPAVQKRHFNCTLLDQNSQEPLNKAKYDLLQGNTILFTGYTNEYGHISLQLLPGIYRLRVSMPGFGTYENTITVKETNYNGIIYMSNTPNILKEVIITSTSESKHENEIGGMALNPRAMSDLPHKMAGGDVNGMLAQLPGVLTGVDGLGGIHVRGGNADQNLFLLDDTPVYNPSHSLGLISIFNPSITKSTTFFKGDLPARYGGRASSVIDIRTKDGNMNRVASHISINGYSASGMVEGPVIKGKSAFLVSFRHSYFDPYIKNKTSNPNVLNADFRNLDYKFHDINVKFNQILGQSDRIYLSYYRGRDNFSAPLTQRTDVAEGGAYFDTINLNSIWGNSILSARWNHLFRRYAFSNLTVSLSKFKYDSDLGLTTDNITPDGRQIRTADYIQIYTTHIRDYALRYDLTFQRGHFLEYKTGINSIFHQINPGAVSVNFQIPGQTTAIVETIKNDLLKNATQKPVELEYYNSAFIRLKDLFFINAGLNTSFFFTGSKTYARFLPRVRLQAGKSKAPVSTWLSYSHLAQYLHQIGSFNIGLPFELWVPSTAKVKPEFVRQLAAGISYGDSTWGLSVEAYYKKLERVLVLQTNSDNILTSTVQESNGWEDRILEGKGSSRGIELLAQRRKGRFTGFISYTLSKTDRQFNDINGGESYPFQFDRRHDLKGNMVVEVCKFANLSITSNYMSGNPITLAGVKYTHLEPDLEDPQKPKEVYIFSKVNGFRLPWIQRWDVALNLSFKPANSKLAYKLQLGCYNVFNRKNPFYQALNLNSTKTKNGIQYTLLPRMPIANFEMIF